MTSSRTDYFESLPQLITDRLVMRRITMDDAWSVFDYVSDPEVVRFSIGEPHQSLEDSERYIASICDAYDQNTAGLWAITRKDNACFMGTCGYELWYQDYHRAEIGYSLSRDNWGKGYATEALRAMVYFGLQVMGLNRIEALTHPDNIPSARVLQKAGFFREGLLRENIYSRGQYFDTEIYSILQRDFVRNVDFYACEVVWPAADLKP